jgi:hypothetical protein
MTPQTSGKGCLGARVRIREVDSVPDELQGLVGTITCSFGHPDHAAHNVLLDGGGPSELFWHYQLKEEAPSGRSGNVHAVYWAAIALPNTTVPRMPNLTFISLPRSLSGDIVAGRWCHRRGFGRRLNVASLREGCPMWPQFVLDMNHTFRESSPGL